MEERLADHRRCKLPLITHCHKICGLTVNTQITIMFMPILVVMVDTIVLEIK
jgi:hypothetical protein